MRVLHVTDSYLPRLGGIELHVADLAARQHGVGHEVTVLTGEPSGSLEPEGPDVVRVPGRLGRTSALAPRTLATVLAEVRPEVVHAHLSVASPYAWSVLRRADVPRIATLHSLLPAHGGVIAAGARVARLPVGEIAWTAVSRVAADRLAAGLGGAAVGVLHNGIDPERWQVAHEPQPRFEILVVGRLAARKRPLEVLDALAALHDRLPDLPWRATFVGDGPQRAQVVAAVRQHGLTEHVRLLGPLPRPEIAALLGRADVFLAAATLESFGIAALEARCAGVPIVAMAASGVGEFVAHDEQGLLVDDVEGITAALARLALDPTLAARLRERSTRTPTGMEWSTVLADHDALYARLLRRSAAAR